MILIVAVDGEPVESAEALVEAIAAYAPGDSVTLDVQGSDGEARTVEATLGTREDDDSAPFLGVQVGGPMMERNRLFATPALPMTGVMVQRVADDSPAAEAGLTEGDVITAVNGEALESFESLRELLAEAAPGDAWTLTVQAMPWVEMKEKSDKESDEESDEETGEARSVEVTLGENEDGNAYLGISAMPMPRIQFHTMPFQGMPCPCLPDQPRMHGEERSVPGDIFFFRSPHAEMPGAFPFGLQLPFTAPGGEWQAAPLPLELPEQDV